MKSTATQHRIDSGTGSTGSGAQHLLVFGDKGIGRWSLGLRFHQSALLTSSGHTQPGFLVNGQLIIVWRFMMRSNYAPIGRSVLVTAYIFIELTTADPQRAGLDQVLTEIRSVSGVKQAHILFGSIDCIAYVECPDNAALGETVVAIRGLRGVAHTDTRPVYS
jgi:hypothetical protein